MHEEVMAEDNVTHEALQSFMEVQGGTLDDKADPVKALGGYRGHKRLRPDFKKGVFVKDDSRETADSSGADKRRIAEQEAKLGNAALEMEKAKEQCPDADDGRVRENDYLDPFCCTTCDTGFYRVAWR